MTKIEESIFLIIVLILLFIKEYSFVKLITGKENGGRVLWVTVLRGTVLRGLVYSAAWYFRLPLVVLFLFILVSYYVTERLCFVGKKEKSILYCCMRFINFSFCFTISTCICSIVNSCGLKEAYESYYTYILALSLLSACLFLPAEIRYISERVLVKKKNLEASQVLYYAIFAVIYQLFDSLLFLCPLEHWQIVVLFFFSNVLINLQLIFFIKYTGEVMENSQHIKEYYRLEEERAEQVKNILKLQKLAYSDGLTGLYNRRYAKEMLEVLQTECKTVTAAYIDVNGLKNVNDTFGHATGDQYLLQVTKCINECLNRADTFSRIGGDEFFVISTAKNQREMETALETANAMLVKSVTEYDASFSFGVVETIKGRYQDAGQILRECDRRMYSDKARKKAGRINTDEMGKI